MSKIFHGRHRVCDCEHEGDIRMAIFELEQLGCEVTDSYWDGRDCGEAYVYVSVSEEVLKKHINELYGEVYFDEDIRKYVPPKSR